MQHSQTASIKPSSKQSLNSYTTRQSRSSKPDTRKSEDNLLFKKVSGAVDQPVSKATKSGVQYLLSPKKFDESAVRRFISNLEK